MRKVSSLLTQFIILNSTFLILVSCSVSKEISKSAQQLVIKDSSLLAAHVGISIYEPSTNKYWFNYQGDKYFVPASNTKLPTCYAAMKYLGDSLVGLGVKEFDDKVYIYGTADPTLLQPDFKNHPVYTYLKSLNKPIWASNSGWQEQGWGSGWSWTDYSADYMAERSALPIFGNVVRFAGKKTEMIFYPKAAVANSNFPIFSKDGAKGYIDRIERQLRSNDFIVYINGKDLRYISVPFITSGELSFKILSDTLQKNIVVPDAPPVLFTNEIFKAYKIHSQPTDSLLKITMHRSDNFFAEQTLLMVSNERLGVMNDEKIIDTLLKTDLKDLPQKPRWVDGSGLSRYDLFTPQDFVSILNKIKTEFGMERIKVILPTGNTGTLANYYKAENGYLFAKTGTLSGVVALSGYLYTKKNKLLIFSVLVNNHQASATAVRRAVEKFIEGIREKF